MTTSPTTGQTPTASPEALEMVTVAGALFGLLLPHANRPILAEAPGPAGTVPVPTAAPQAVVPSVPAAPATLAVPSAPTPPPAAPGGIPVPVLDEVVPPPAPAPVAPPTPTPASIRVPTVPTVQGGQDRPAPRTMAMLTEIGFLDD